MSVRNVAGQIENALYQRESDLYRSMTYLKDH
ncbi:hypothetical protein [Microbulbifer taiwanensis]|uniref:Uncharacterized protein n=1 Tax=Microbulbifer taiwanensis TaxID=986746 RepID=A0ABW1YT71_9GAMM